MSPRQNPAQDQGTSKNDYPLRDLESQTQDLPLPQNTSTITAGGKKENRANSTKDTREEGNTTWTATLSALSLKQTYFDKMPIAMMTKTKGDKEEEDRHAEKQKRDQESREKDRRLEKKTEMEEYLARKAKDQSSK